MPTEAKALRLDPTHATIAVLGLGYVGLPVAGSCAAAGFTVRGIDIDPDRIAALEQDAIDGPEAFVLRAARRDGRLSWHADPAQLRGADVVFICVPTPHGEHDAVLSCADAIASHARPDALVILESTVRPGFVRTLQARLGHGGAMALAFAPERIDPGRHAAGQPHRSVPRLVSGTTAAAQARAMAVFAAMGVPAHPVRVEEAELAKLFENTFRLVNIALVDQLASLCRARGIDPNRVIDAAATKDFGFHPFRPGGGAGGHCVPIDPTFLADEARRQGSPMTLVDDALRANQQRPRDVADQIDRELGGPSTILVVGLTYRPGIADLRESAAVVTSRALRDCGHRVLAWDPLISPPSDLESVDLITGLQEADAVAVLVSPPPAVRQLLRDTDRPLFDATHTLSTARSV